MIKTALFASLAVMGVTHALAQSGPMLSPPAAQQAEAPNWPAANPLINPFSGKTLTSEQIQQELEATRLHTQLLEEQLKQTNIAAEMRNVPMRKSVEAAQATTAVKKEEVNQAEIARALKAALHGPTVAPQGGAGPSRASGAPPARSATPDKKPSPKKSEEKKAEEAKPAATPAKPIQPVLVSVVTLRNRRSVVLDIAGASMVVPDGGMTPFGAVVILDDASANIGGREYSVHQSTLSRFVSSDVAPPAPPKATAAPATGAPVTRPVTPANSLPPLMLPPGVSVISPPK